MTRKLKEYPSVALKPEDLCGEIDFNQVFGRSCPLHIEVGTGKATFLLSQAITHPDINFLGIERANKYYRYAVDRIGRWSVTNVRIIRTDAAAFLAPAASCEARAGVPSNSVDCFHIYFPDPWPKRRHHKRRFFCPVNLENLIRCLKTGGVLRIATDHAEYFEQIKRLIAEQSGRLEQIEFLPAAGVEPGELTGTNYERKYIKDKRRIYTFAVRKK
jgi:tRNA (guanine-N7-)-methyltransferase